MPETYSFDGTITTFIGLVGLISTFAIMVTVYRRYWNSPYRR